MSDLLDFLRNLFLKKKKEKTEIYAKWAVILSLSISRKNYNPLTFHADFGQIRFLKWRDVIDSNSWFFGNIKRVFKRFAFIQANYFFF